MALGGEGFIFDNLTADPPSPEEGTEWFRSDLSQFRRQVGGQIKVSANLDDVFHHFEAAQLITPNNADWTVNELAPMSADSNNAGLTVRLFDDTTEEGVGFQTLIPVGVTKIVVELKSRAETGPGAVRTVGLKLYNRKIPDNAAVGSWSAGVALNDIDIPATDEFFQYDLQAITLATLGITAGEETQFELTRVAPQAGTNLEGDWSLNCVQLRFSL